MSDLVFDKFIRTPFQVEAVKINNQNMDQIAKLISGEVKKRGKERYIVLNPEIIPNVRAAYVGWYVTILGDGFRCYAPKVFRDQFTSMEGNPVISFTVPEDVTMPPKVTVGGSGLVELPQPTEGGLTGTEEDVSGDDQPQTFVGQITQLADAIPTVNDDLTDAERAMQTFIKTD